VCVYTSWLAHKVRGWTGLKIALRFPFLLVCVCIPTCHVRNNYVRYIVAMQLYFGRLDGCFEYILVQLLEYILVQLLEVYSSTVTSSRYQEAEAKYT